jgi:hypothetical protein
MHVNGSLSQEGASGDENSSLSDLAPHHNAGKVHAALDEVAQRNREECSSSVTTTFHEPGATLHLAHLAIPGPSEQ